MSGITIALAFLAGIVSFASPCCLPLVPGYIGYMVGTTPDGPARRMVALRQSLAFVLGFSFVFVALWASVGVVGYVLRDYAALLRQVGGAILVFMGLNVAGVINVATLYRDVRLPIGPGAATAGGTMALGGGFGAPVTAGAQPSYPRSALLGVFFAAGWTPCIGPILGGIIGLASASASVVEGSVLLVAYAAGLAVPFVLVALGATAVSERLGWLRRHHHAVSVVTGAMLVAVGFLMITNSFVRLSGLLPPFGV
jgi:cytochrome c-type biogenesis protein